MKVRAAIVTIVSMFAAVVATAPIVSAQDAAPTCAGRQATIIADGSGEVTGTDGNDVIVGTGGADIIDAGLGDDVICALGGADIVFSGPGNDLVIGGNGADDIRAGLGADTVYAGNGNDMVRGGFGEDVLVGGANADFLAGGPGADTVFAGLGNDTVLGGNGSDRLEGGGGNDFMGGGNQTDIVRGGAGSDEVIGGGGKLDFVNGGTGSDICRDRGANTQFTQCESDFELTILHINDHHSHLESGSGDLEFPGGETRVSQGGFPLVVAKMDELTDANSGGNVVKIHAGDAITGTLYYSLFEGEADAALMNEACFDIMALGNHEFDGGDQGLADFLGDLADSETCGTTSVLAANVVPAAGTPLNPSGEVLFDKSKVINYGDQRVGYVGIDIANKTQNSSSPLETTEFFDEVETAQAEVDALTAVGVDKIVLVTHIQLANDIDLASMVSGVDVIVGGDSHSLLGNFAPLGLNANGPYPVKTSDADGNPVCIVQAWQYSAIVGELSVKFDDAGVVTSCDGTPHLLLEDSLQRRPDPDADRVELEGAERQSALDFIEATPELSIVTPDADATAALEEFSGQVDALTAEVVGNSSDDLCLERIPGQGRSSICDVADTATNGGDIQQLVTDAFRIRSFESDIALQNAGGVRVDIPAGDVTIADVYELLPFANTIVNLEMSGSEIAQVLEEALTFTLDPDGSTGAYPYASGLRWDVDLTAGEGERISNLEFLDGDTWVPFDTEATYIVATNSFIAAGRDGYFTFGTVSDDGRATDTFLDYAQSFIDYIELDAQGTLAKLPTELYSTQSIVPLPAE